MSARGKRDLVMTGVWVVGTLVSITVIVLVLAKAGEWFERTSAYTVRFTIAEGAVGLKPGSEVRLGGQRVGRVERVKFTSDEGGVPGAIEVSVVLQADKPLYTDARFTLETPLLGSVSTLNIFSTGTRAGGLAQAGHVFEATLAAPSFLKSAGYGEEQVTQVQAVIADARQITAQLKGMLAKIDAEVMDKRLLPSLDNVKDATADAREIASTIKSRTPGWADRITSVLSNLDEAIIEIKSISPEVKAAVAVARSMMERADPKIQAALDDVKDLVHKINTDAYARVMKVVAEGDRALTALADTAEGLRSQLPELRVTLANLRLSSDQLKLTMTEVRRNPWRLLYQPGKKELERELLYDAARSYAEAVSDLRAASATLEQVAAAGAAPVSAELRDALKAQLEAAMKRYKEAESAFMNRILANP